MIIVYPMLTSDTISHNLLSGISKVLERFVIVYRLEDDIKRIGGLKNYDINLINFSLFQKKLKSMGEMYNIAEAPPNLPVPSRGGNAPAHGGNKGGALLPSTTSITIPKPTTDEYKGGLSKVDYPNKQEILLEPTYITATSKKGPTLIGVKVLPFILKPTKKGVTAADIMQSDKDLNASYTIAVGVGRKLIRLAWASWRSGLISKLPFLTRTISGDPKKDILYASTTFGEDTFICMDSMDMKFSTSQSASKVRKLHYLGWRSFVLADNVNRRANFCMKEFKGICNIIPYSYLFSSLGKEQKQTYEDLEDIKKSSAAFFRRRMPLSKVLGEQLAQSNLNNMQFIDEGQLIQEGIFDFAKQMGDKVISGIKKAISSKNSSSLSKVLDKVPDIDLEKLKSFGKKQSPDFQKSYSLAKRVIDNSLPNDTADELKDHYAVAIALKAVSREGNALDNTKEELKLSLPAIMRAIGSGAATTAWILLWYLISQVIFTFPGPQTIIIGLIIIARGIYKYAKNEKKLDLKNEKHKKELEKIAMDVERQKAKSKRSPLIQVQNATSGE